MPVWLVEVAANAKTKHEREFVATELISLRQAQLIECHRVNGASGISLTEAGRTELRALNQGKPANIKRTPFSSESPPSQAFAVGVPCTGCGSRIGQHHAPECPNINAFTAGRIGTPPMPDALGERQVKAPPAPDAGPLPDLEHLDPELQPRLYSLVMALAKLAMADLAEAIDARDLARARERQRLLDRVHRHLGRPS